MSLRDDAVVALLVDDLEQLGDGVTRKEVSDAAITRWPDSVIRRLRREGYVIEETTDAYRLYSVPVSTGTPAARAAVLPTGRGVSGVPAGSVPRLFRSAA